MPGSKRLCVRFFAALVLTGALLLLSVAVGRYPILWEEVLEDTLSRRVLLTLRLPRTLMALTAGFGLGVAGGTYQTVLQNPLASPDVIGVSSGASAGAAAAILFLDGGLACVTLAAFTGGFLAVLSALALASAAQGRGMNTIVLSGIAVNAVSQALLMLMKLAGDPERHLAAIEFWTMGSFADVTLRHFLAVLPWAALGLAGLLLLHRQVLLLGLEPDEAHMLGVPVQGMRYLVLLLATLVTGAVVSVTGLISFVGLLAPHIARLITRNSRFSTVMLSGVTGGALLLASDILARSIGSSEVPVSVVTSLLGAPFLFWLMCRREAGHG